MGIKSSSLSTIIPHNFLYNKKQNKTSTNSFKPNLIMTPILICVLNLEWSHRQKLIPHFQTSL